jgi:hypothetical protein
VRCDRLRIISDESPTEVGFFTTRAVDAGTADEAVDKAFHVILAEVQSRAIDPIDNLPLAVETVAPQRWWWRRLRPPAGFTFFLLDPADEYRIDD